jgi:hypothetical protein
MQEACQLGEMERKIWGNLGDTKNTRGGKSAKEHRGQALMDCLSPVTLLQWLKA